MPYVALICRKELAREKRRAIYTTSSYRTAAKILANGITISEHIVEGHSTFHGRPYNGSAIL